MPRRERALSRPSCKIMLSNESPPRFLSGLPIPRKAEDCVVVADHHVVARGRAIRLDLPQELGLGQAHRPQEGEEAMPERDAVGSDVVVPADTQNVSLLPQGNKVLNLDRATRDLKG